MSHFWLSSYLFIIYTPEFNWQTPDIAHLQLFVKDKFVGVYKILGLDFSSILSIHIYGDTIFILDNPEYVYVNNDYLIIEKEEETVEFVKGLHICDKLEINNKIFTIFKITEKNDENEKYVFSKGASISKYNLIETYDDDELMTDVRRHCENNPVSKNVTIDWRDYATVGGLLYHTSKALSGSKITKMFLGNIHYTLLTGHKGKMKITEFK